MHPTARRIAVILVLLGLSAACSDFLAPAAPSGTDFIRFVEKGDSGGRLETAVVRYENEAGRRVDLISAVHLADSEYYETLQILFTGYDSLLYEMVADEGMKPSREEQSDNLLSRFQRNLCRAMELSFQLDAIDYDRENFVHADLTAAEFVRLWNERGESFFSIVMRVLSAQFKALQSGAGQNLSGPALLDALRSPERAARLKLLLAREFEHVEAVFAGMETEEEGEESLLLGERNKAAIGVLEREMRDGAERLGIFYGAGHMPDLEKRLLRGFGFKKVQHNWITAWDIDLRKKGRSE